MNEPIDKNGIFEQKRLVSDQYVCNCKALKQTPISLREDPLPPEIRGESGLPESRHGLQDNKNTINTKNHEKTGKI